jgi:hypothetical protein
MIRLRQTNQSINMNFQIKSSLIKRLGEDNYNNIFDFIRYYYEEPISIMVKQYFFHKTFDMTLQVISNMTNNISKKYLQEKPCYYVVFHYIEPINKYNENMFYINSFCSKCGDYVDYPPLTKNITICNCNLFSDMPNLVL